MRLSQFKNGFIKFIALTLFFTVSILFSSPAEAGIRKGMGIGAYLSGSGSISDIKVKTTSLRSLRGQYTRAAYGGGFVLDTNLDQRKVFNYRFKVGAEKVETLSHSGYRIVRISQWNTFGLGIVRLELFRLWAGPVIGVSYDLGTRSGRRYAGVGNPTIPHRYFVYSDPTLLLVSGVLKDKVSKIGIWNFKGGAAVGFNINITRVVTLSFEAGAAAGLLTGKWRHRVYDYYTSPTTTYTGYKMKLNTFSEKLSGLHYEAFLHIAVIARGRWIGSL